MACRVDQCSCVQALYGCLTAVAVAATSTRLSVTRITQHHLTTSPSKCSARGTILPCWVVCVLVMAIKGRMLRCDVCTRVQFSLMLQVTGKSDLDRKWLRARFYHVSWSFFHPRWILTFPCIVCVDTIPICTCIDGVSGEAARVWGGYEKCIR